MNKQTTFILFSLLLNFCIGQNFILDSIKTQYDFINYDKNELKFADSSKAFQRLFKKLEAVKNNKREDIHIFHIGGSHIQADIYSNKVRHYFQNMSEYAKGQRGFVFPYKLAKTNNPLNYKITSDKEWIGYRCSRPDTTEWGMSGVTAKFTDSICHVNIKANYKNYSKNTYNFNKIRVFYDNWTEDYSINLTNNTLVKRVSQNYSNHYIEFELNQTLEEVDLCIEQKSPDSNKQFLMMGMELMNDDTGIEYTSIGVNGASFEYYNKCNYFEDHLILYSPDMFIISIGTNDTYTTNFDKAQYKVYYESFIQLILRANPNCAILLTVPNDSYYKRRYANPNTKLAAEVIYDLAEKYNMAVWDFYEVMGGFNSSQSWYRNKLMPRDRIHFTKLGYSIKADLLLEAIVKSWQKESNEPNLLNRFKSLE